MAQALARAELGWEAWRRFRIEADLSPRPLRLLARPESIEDVFALVPDGPPVRSLEADGIVSSLVEVADRVRLLPKPLPE